MPSIVCPTLQGPVLTDAMTPEDVKVSAYVQPFSQPSRYPRGLPVSVQRFAVSPFLPPATPIDGWFCPFSQPSRKPIGLGAAQQMYYPAHVIVPENALRRLTLANETNRVRVLGLNSANPSLG